MRIGKEYHAKPGTLLDPTKSKYIKVPVYHRAGRLDAYTIVRAQVPPDWINGPEV
jgi:hypothetical protein